MALDAFPRLKEINESNFLRPQPNNLAKNTSFQSFRDALATLSSLKKPLQLLHATGRLGEITNWQQYMEALRWLNGETALSQWVSVQQIDNYKAADEGLAENFNGFVTSLRNHLNGQLPFQQAQMYVAAVELKIVGDIVQEEISPLQAEFDQTLDENRSSLIASLEKLQSQKQSDLSKVFGEQLQNIKVEKDNAIAEFTQARALANWSDFYAERVGSYEHLLYGKRWPTNAVKRKYHSWRAYRRTVPSPGFWNFKHASITAFMMGAGRCIVRALSIIGTKLYAYAGRRTAWFTVLVIGIAAIIIANVASVYDVHSILGVDPTKLRPEHNDTQLFAKIAIYIAFFAVPALGYSFANKNYRIYSNILEQYRHREVVAKTIQGILAQPSDESNADIRKELTNVAAVALFEQKTTGHLTKNEANSTSVLDIAKIFRS